MGVCTEVWCFCVLGALAHCLAALSNLNHNLQSLLNTLWYNLALVVLARLDRWPNYTTGQLTQVPRCITATEQTIEEELQTVEPIVQELPQVQRAEICYLRETIV